MKKKLNYRKGISLIIHTKNEERNIVNCIKSAKDIVDEIIIIDMYSTDKTVKLAEKFGAKVYYYKDIGIADPSKNFGIQKANYQWILSLDADELIPTSLKAKIFSIIQENEYDIVSFPFKNMRLGIWMKHTGWWPDYHPRLFKNGYLKWPPGINQAHLQPILTGNILLLDSVEENAILHNNVMNMREYYLKILNSYFLDGSGDYFNNKKFTLKMLTSYCEGEFKWRYVEQQGYLDGMRGYIFSKFREYIRFVEFVNWWERKGYPDVFTDDELLEATIIKEVDDFKSSKIFRLWKFYNKQKKLIEINIRKLI
jgi:glycosyltransferase involved in cell wall biosynthesis